MRKFILIAAMAFGMIAMQSCNDTQFGVLYSVRADGDAAGDVRVKVPQGSLTLDGTATLCADFTNDTTATVFGTAVGADADYVLGEALHTDDAKVVAAATATNDWFERNFSVTSASGDYCVHFAGVVRERVTGLTFTIDKTFTNRTNTTPTDSTTVVTDSTTVVE